MFRVVDPFRGLAAVFYKEVLHMRRDTMAMLFALFVPIVEMIILGAAIEPNNDPPDWIPTPTPVDPAPADPTPSAPGGVITALPNTGTGASDSATGGWLPLLALGLVALATLAIAPKLAARRA